MGSGSGKSPIISTEFMSLPFRTTAAALITSPETEILVETALATIEENGHVDVLEIGTGSGIIAISLA